MIIVLVYVDGQVQYGTIGAEYNVPPKMTFPASETTTYEDIKNEIFQGFGYVENLCKLNIQARFDVGYSGPHYFQLIPLYEDRGWKMIFQKTMERANWQIIELYINHAQSNVGLSPTRDLSSQVEKVCLPSSASLEKNTVHSVVIRASCDVFAELNTHRNGINQSTLSCSPSIDNVVERNDMHIEHPEDIHVDAHPEEDEIIQDGSDYDNSEYDDSDYDEYVDDDETFHEESSEEEDLGQKVVQSMITFPFMHGFDQHHVKAFHDISTLKETAADEGFFGRKKQFNGPLSEGRTFDSKTHLQIAISEFHINLNVEVKSSSSSLTKLVVECTDSKCLWRLYATPTHIGTCWKINKCPYDHTCRAPTDRFDHSQLSSGIIADVIGDALKDDLELSMKTVQSLVRERYKSVKPSYSKLWCGKEKAISQLFGSWEGSYALLIPFLEVIKVQNPGTKYILLSDPVSQEGCRAFKCVASAFGPCVDAIPHLRPVISVDACFLSGRYKGRLLIACGYDANNQLLPLAFAVVEKEDSKNLGWFMRWLRREVIGIGKFMCVISDRHKAIKWIFKQTHIGWNESNGECVHRLCSQHIAENLYKNCCDKMVLNTFKWVVKKKKTS